MVNSKAKYNQEISGISCGLSAQGWRFRLGILYQVTQLFTLRDSHQQKYPSLIVQFVKKQQELTSSLSRNGISIQPDILPVFYCSPNKSHFSSHVNIGWEHLLDIHAVLEERNAIGRARTHLLHGRYICKTKKRWTRK